MSCMHLKTNWGYWRYWVTSFAALWKSERVHKGMHIEWLCSILLSPATSWLHNSLKLLTWKPQTYWWISSSHWMRIWKDLASAIWTVKQTRVDRNEKASVQWPADSQNLERAPSRILCTPTHEYCRTDHVWLYLDAYACEQSFPHLKKNIKTNLRSYLWLRSDEGLNARAWSITWRSINQTTKLSAKLCRTRH